MNVLALQILESTESADGLQWRGPGETEIRRSCLKMYSEFFLMYRTLFDNLAKSSDVDESVLDTGTYRRGSVKGCDNPPLGSIWFSVAKFQD